MKKQRRFKVTEFIDEIVWGNESKEDSANIAVENYLDKLLPQLTNKAFNPPFNSSDGTMQELNLLMSYSEKGNESERRFDFDKGLVHCVNQIFINNGVDPVEVKATTNNIITDVLPLITKLKYKWRRPRPHQLAYYYGLQFYPNYSYFVSSPSYPSGHTTMAAIMAEVLGNQYAVSFPNCYDVMQSLTHEVAESRLYMGVHYASDNRFSYQISKAVIDLPDFRRKYSL